MDFILLPFALIGVVGIFDVLLFKGAIGVKLAGMIHRGA
jgi:hypothetical protein